MLCIGRAQLTPAQLNGIRELQKKLTPARFSSAPPHARTQNTYAVDSLYNDLYDNSTSSWQEYRLYTYDYYPNSTLVRADSLFRRSGATWIDSAETRYYYTATQEDSIQVTYFSPDGTTWEPSDSVAFSYATSSNVTLQTAVAYEYNITWKPVQRQRIWYSNNRPDSTAFDTFNINTNSWDEVARGWFKYAGTLLDSVRIRAELGSAQVIYLQKYFYDVASRANYIRDTLYASLGFFNQPLQASEEFITYTTPTSQQIAIDSFVVRSYFPSPDQITQVSRYSYDANDNVEIIVYEDCAPVCEPYERDRYVYRLIPSALVPGKGSTYSLCGRACESLTLPQGWEGLPYELYNLGGQKLSQGTLGGTLTLPARPGLYILLTRGQAYRLQVLP